MATKTDIANEALILVGEKRIVSIEDTTSLNASFINGIWDTTVKEVSTALPWRCLTKRTSLPRDADGPAFGWDYSFTLPTDHLRDLYLNDRSAPDRDYYSIEGKKIVTNATSAELTYTAFISDESYYCAQMVEVLSLYLAAKICGVRKQDAEITKYLTEQYRGSINAYAGDPSVAETKSMWHDIGDSNSILTAAIGKISEPRHVDFGDPNFITKTMAENIYTECINEMSRDHPWRCMLSQAVLTASEDTPLFGFDFIYELPEDCVRIMEVNGVPLQESMRIYKVYKGRIYTDAETLELEYVSKPDDAISMDPLLASALTALVAFRFAEIRRPQVAEKLYLEYQSFVSRARAIDLTQQNPKEVLPQRRSRSIKARGSFYV